MKHLLGGQIGLEDFIFAHRKGETNFHDFTVYKKLIKNIRFELSQQKIKGSLLES